MIAGHVQAVLDRLRANPNLTVFDGAVPGGVSPGQPYVVVYFNGLARLGDELTLRSTQRTGRIYCHSIGATAEAARIVAQHVATQLLDYVAEVPGWLSWPIRHESNQPPARDESTGEYVMDQIDTYVMQTQSSW